MHLVNYRVVDIDTLRGRSKYLCEHLCCMVFVASDLQACGAFWCSAFPAALGCTWSSSWGRTALGKGQW